MYTLICLSVLYVYIDLVVCVIYSLCNTSLMVATNGDRNMKEVYNDYDIINSHIFIRICWFESNSGDSFYCVN